MWNNKSRVTSVTTKQLLSRALLLMAVAVVASASSLSQEQRISSTRVAENNILIVYLSRTENTGVLANIIREQVGGRLERIETQTPYPSDYDAIVAKVAKENETGYLPPIKTNIQNIRTYDIVFVGFPTWGMQLPPPNKKLPEGTRSKRQDRCSIQHAWRVRKREQLPIHRRALSKLNGT